MIEAVEISYNSDLFVEKNFEYGILESLKLSVYSESLFLVYSIFQHFFKFSAAK